MNKIRIDNKNRHVCNDFSDTNSNTYINNLRNEDTNAYSTVQSVFIVSTI
jgi:hypothetical protein